MQIYVLSGRGSAFAGIVPASYTGAGAAYAAQGVELTVIATVILGGTSLLGGRGSILGTLLGIALLGAVNNGLTLRGLGNQWQLIVTAPIPAHVTGWIPALDVEFDDALLLEIDALLAETGAGSDEPSSVPAHINAPQTSSDKPHGGFTPRPREVS